MTHLAAFKINSENGLEVQNSSCGECGIMMRLNLVKGGSYHDNLGHGVTHCADFFMDLVLPWVNNHRMVCSDSYFSSFTAAEFLYLNGLDFIGFVQIERRK